MFKLQLPVFVKFRDAEFVQLMNTILDVVKKNPSIASALQSQIAALEIAVQKMILVLNESKGITVNAELKPLDDIRVNSLRGLKWYLKAEIFRKREDRLKHAKLLMACLKQHCDKMDKMSYQHKTMAINKLLMDCKEDPALQEAVTAINAENYLADLTSQNDFFYQSYVVKAETREQDTRTANLRAAVRAQFDELVADTQAHARIGADKESFQAIIKLLNNVINLNNAPVEGRRSRKKKEEAPMSMLPVPVIS